MTAGPTVPPQSGRVPRRDDAELDALNERVRAAGGFVAEVESALQRVVVGQRAMLQRLLVGLLADGHVLLEGVPGLAKTLAVRALAAVVDCRFQRIQFTPDLLPADLVGTMIYNQKTAEFTVQRGPIFGNIILADEINRAPAKTQAALLEAMQERQVTTDGVARPLDQLFTVFATQNPVEYEGTYPLPEAQLDRFLVKIKVAYPSKDAELEMLTRYTAGFDADQPGSKPVAPVLDEGGCRALRMAVDAVKVAPEVREYVTDIVRATREDTGLTLGGSPRAIVALFRASRGAALMAGRDFVTPDDVKDYAPAVLRHRVIVAPELEVEGRTADDVLQGVLTRVHAPK